MLKNNIEIDVKVKCVEEQITQAELAEKTGTSPSYVNRLIKKPEKIVNNTFIKMMEQIGKLYGAMFTQILRTECVLVTVCGSVILLYILQECRLI